MIPAEAMGRHAFSLPCGSGKRSSEQLADGMDRARSTIGKRRLPLPHIHVRSVGAGRSFDGVAEAVEANRRRRVLPFRRPALAGAGGEIDQADVPGLQFIENL